MKKLLRIILGHIAQYAIGYAVGLFLLIAAVTCGVMQGRTVELIVSLDTWSVLRIVLCELLFFVGLLLSATHPFGCAISVVMLIGKGLLGGLGLGWWFHAAPGKVLPALLLFLQTVIGSVCLLYACCITAYAALQVSRLNKRDHIRRMLICLMIQMLCVLMRCIACAWAI